MSDVWTDGAELPARRYRVTRADLVAYAGASGDQNPIHWSDRVATAVGLPGVVAHGMYTMALGGRALVSWADDPARVVEYGVRFTRPVVVPDDDDGVDIEVRGVVGARDGDLVRVALTVSCGETAVLGQARAVIRVSSVPSGPSARRDG